MSAFFLPSTKKKQKSNPVRNLDATTTDFLPLWNLGRLSLLLAGLQALCVPAIYALFVVNFLLIARWSCRSLASSRAGFGRLDDGRVVSAELLAFDIFCVDGIREVVRAVLGVEPSGA